MLSTVRTSSEEQKGYTEIVIREEGLSSIRGVMVESYHSILTVCEKVRIPAKVKL